MANTNSAKTAWIVAAVVALAGMAAAVVYFWHKSTVTDA